MAGRGRPKGTTKAASKSGQRGFVMSSFNQGLKHMTKLGKRADAKSKKDWADLLEELKARDKDIVTPVAPKGKRTSEVGNVDSNATEEYEAERILDSKTIKGELNYYVLWQNFRFGDSTWEPKSNLTNSAALIEEFYAANPTKPGGPSASKVGRASKK